VNTGGTQDDPFEGIELTAMASKQLDELRRMDEPLYALLLAQIQHHLSSWSPGTEDGRVIDHAATMSRECCWDVFRLSVSDRRIFFTYLNGKKPHRRLVLAVVERTADTYDDPTQQHFIEVRNTILNRKFRGDIKRRK
jgi:hypothetical protein